MKPHTIGEGKLRGIIYMLGFPSLRALYIGSSTQPGSVRFRQHLLRLNRQGHPNAALQSTFNQLRDGMVVHVLATVYGVSKTELMNYEWGLSIRCQSEYTCLSDDPTKVLKHYLEPEDEEAIMSIITQLMNPTT